MRAASASNEPEPLGAGRSWVDRWARVALGVFALAWILGIGGYLIVRGQQASDRAALAAAQRDPMAQFVPPGATLDSETAESSAWPSTRRSATVERTFGVAEAEAADAFKATLAAARTAGWRIEASNEDDPDAAYGDRPSQAGWSMEVRLLSEETGVQRRSLYLLIRSDVL